MIDEILLELQRNNMINIMLLLIVGDTILGFLRSCKEKVVNSSIGIDGLLRKAAIVVAVGVTFLADVIFNFNMIGFLPEMVLDFIKVKEVGLCEIFGVLFIIFESLSILKNLKKMNIPTPTKLEEGLEKLLGEFTDENGEKKNEKRN